jgi:hypothetical protein
MLQMLADCTEYLKSKKKGASARIKMQNSIRIAVTQYNWSVGQFNTMAPACSRTTEYLNTSFTLKLKIQADHLAN